MTDQRIVTAGAESGAAAPFRSPARVGINLVCLILIGVIVLASLVAVHARVDPRTVAIIAGGPVTALFGLINRSAAE